MGLGFMWQEMQMLHIITTLDKRFNKHTVEIKISDNEEKQEQLDVALKIKDVPYSIWEIKKYNTSFLGWNEIK